MIRVILPFHLRNLAHIGAEVTLEVEGPVTQRSVLDALEARYPMLRGAIREHGTLQRRPFCASSPAKRISPTSRQTLRYPSEWRRGKNRSL